MATTIILKKSATTASVPLTGDLELGELAVNYADRKIYAKDGSGNVFNLAGAQVGTAFTGTAVEGDLWYDTANNILKAHNGTSFVAAGYTTLASLDDTTITSVASGEILKYNGSAWVNNTLAEAGIAAASHNHAASAITSGTFADARIAQSNVTQHQAALSITESQISDLGAYLTGITGEPLSDLSDVTITSIAANEILKWDGTKWINNTLSEAGIAAASHTHTFASLTSKPTTIAGYGITDAFDGAYSSLSGIPSTFAPSAHTLDSHSNVTITSNSAGEILKWNGTAWINNTLSEAGIQPAGSYAAASHTHTVSNITDLTATATELNYTDGVTSNIQTQLNGKASTSHNHTLDGLSNTTITSNTAGEILKWNGTAWVNNTLAEAGIQPAGAYLTSESDTLATVTGRGATSSNAISLTNNTASSSTSTGALTVTGGVGIGGALNVGGNTIITGDLTVNGTTTTVNSNTVNIGDNIIVLNADEAGVPSQDGGIEIERGTSSNVSFKWIEASDYWSLGNQTLGDVTIDGGSY